MKWTDEYIDTLDMNCYCTDSMVWIPHGLALSENTFDLKEDTNFLYNLIFRDSVEMINGNRPFQPLSLAVTRSTEILISKVGARTHFINPAKIVGGYIPDDGVQSKIILNNSEEDVIVLTYNNRALTKLLSNDLDFQKISKGDKVEERRLRQEFTQETIKAMIIHELSHWVSNTFYNNHISSYLLKIQNDAIKKEHLFFEYFEIDAQIHAIKEIKAYYINEWGRMTLADIFRKYSALYSIIARFQFHYDSKGLSQWLKDLVKRMNRENLLGDSMRIKDLEVFAV